VDSETIIDGATGELVQVTSLEAMEAVAKHDAAALDVQVATAKKYPRSEQKFLGELEALCTQSQSVAESCFYSLPRGNSKLLGASIRFAEMVMACYGNIVVETHILEEAEKTVVVSATCRDLERNIAARAEVVRNITKRNGQRYDDATIQSTIQAASAISRRNAIFSVVPRAKWEGLYHRAMSVAAGKDLSFSDQKKQAIQKIRDLGCDTKKVKAFLGRDTKELTLDDVMILRLKAKAIEANEVSADEAFPVAKPDKASAEAEAESITAKIRGK